MAHIPISIEAGGIDCDDATATQADIRMGKTAGIAGSEDIVTGTMAEIAGRTITPGTSQQIVSGGGYLLGNIVVPRFSMPSKNVIKKGATITIYGQSVTGEWEGYVPAATDLYYRGNNVLGFSNSQMNFQSGSIWINNEYTRQALIASKTFNFDGYSNLKVTYRVNSMGHPGTSQRTLLQLYNSGQKVAEKYQELTMGREVSITLNCSGAAATFAPAIYLEQEGYIGGGDSDHTWADSNWTGYIYQIEVS